MGGAIGLLSAAVAVASGELVAAVVGRGAAPVIAVGGAAIDAAPTWLKSWAIATFGDADKTVLVAGIGAVLIVVAWTLGVMSLRRPWVGVVGVAGLGVVGAVAAAARPAAPDLAIMPSALGALAGLAAYRWLRVAAALDGGATTASDGPRGGATHGSPASSPRIGGYDRRRFLLTGLATAGVAVTGAGAGRLLSSRASAEASRASASVPVPRGSAVPIPAGADLGVPGLSPFITPNDRFYRVDTALFVPAVDAETWRLRVHGMVERELDLTYAGLVSRPSVERDITLACVSNEVGGSYVGNARWIGVPLADVLAEAGVLDGATQLVSTSADGWTCGTPVAAVTDGRDALLAVSMNGEPLPLDHGFPVRMVVPGLYGYVSATKWLVDLELTTFEAFDAYWIRRGWAEQAPIKTQSRIDTPRASDRLAAGDITVAGVAWAQHRGIEAVEVQVDGGPWLAAELATEDTVDTWRQWRYRWPATPGLHSIAVRATDGDGVVQTADPVPPFPDGATGHHTIVVDVG